MVNLGTSSLGDSDVGSDTARRDSESSNTRDPLDEEYQIQLALELSAREDPEAAQIEAVKQISLGSFPPQNTPAEVVAYKYWVSSLSLSLSPSLHLMIMLKNRHHWMHLLVVIAA